MKMLFLWMVFGCSACSRNQGGLQDDCSTMRCCRGVDDCRDAPNFANLCLAPGESPGSGACSRPPPCTKDSDCADAGTQSICDHPPSACVNELACTPGCSQTGCALGQVCGPDGRCKVTPCPGGD